MEIQFTLSQIVGIATAITAIVTTYNLIRKPLKEREKSEKERDEKIAAISTMLEPILMVVMALLVGGMMAATLLPIYSLVNNI